MDKVTLQTQPRETGHHALRALRQTDHVPAVVYGKGREPQAVMVDRRELHRALVAAGAGLISLQMDDGSTVQVLAREVQRHPVKHRALHVDFQAVSMTERLHVNVPIMTEGEAPALKMQGVVLSRNMDTVEVECLPTDIPSHLVANLSGLETAEDSIYVRDLAVPAGVKIMDEPDMVVFSLTVTREEVEEEEVEAAAEAEVEVVGRGKREEEEE